MKTKPTSTVHRLVIPVFSTVPRLVIPVFSTVPRLVIPVFSTVPRLVIPVFSTVPRLVIPVFSTVPRLVIPVLSTTTVFGIDNCDQPDTREVYSAPEDLFSTLTHAETINRPSWPPASAD